jgi:hypothetical protein
MLTISFSRVSNSLYPSFERLSTSYPRISLTYLERLETSAFLSTYSDSEEDISAMIY